MPTAPTNLQQTLPTPLSEGLELCRAIARNKAAGCSYLRWLFSRFLTMESVLRSWSQGNTERERQCKSILRNNGHAAGCHELDDILVFCRGESSTGGGDSGSETTVLLVDDDPLLLRSLSRILRRRSLRVFQATSPDRALLLLSTRRVDLVVSDFEMPGDTDGLQLLEDVKRRFPRVRRALMSGKHPGQLQRALNEQLIERFLPKGSNFRSLATDIEQLAQTPRSRKRQ